MRMGVLLVGPAAAATDDPTHALFAGQSHSIPDNLMALLSPRRAWNCSPKIAALFPVRHILLLVHCPSKRGALGRNLGHMRSQRTAPRPAGCLWSARMLTKAQGSHMSRRDPKPPFTNDCGVRARWVGGGIQPDGVADDLGRKPIAGDAGASRCVIPSDYSPRRATQAGLAAGLANLTVPSGIFMGTRRGVQ